MKVLLAGGTRNFIMEAIVNKLLKEECSVYHIAGKSSSRGSRTINKKIVTYDTDLDDEYIHFVIKSIMPDVVIFAGAFDERYIWKDYHRCSSKYMCDLTNIMVTAADLNVKKFLYLSTLNVYGFDSHGKLDETVDPSPQNVKSIIIEQGERLCENMSKSRRINAISLRFGTIYGSTHVKFAQSDYVMNKCIGACIENKLTVNNQIMPLISCEDVSIAVYKTAYLEGESGNYNVCDNETITDKEISDIILEEYADIDIEVIEDTRFKPQDYTIDGSKFNTDYSFFQKINYKEGITAVAKFVRENQYRFARAQQENLQKQEDMVNVWAYLKFLGQKALPFIENIVVFLLFVLIKYFAQGNLYLSSVDYMALYVIVISVTFGKPQAVLAVFLVLLDYSANAVLSEGKPWVEVFMDYTFLVKLMFYFIVGMIVGHTRDRAYQKMADIEERVEYVENEHAKLNEINDVTNAVKENLEERLLSQGDSLARIYALIEQIDSTTTPKIYLESLGVTSGLLKSENICIYLPDKEQNYVFNLEYWTSEEAKKMDTQINILDHLEMAEHFKKDQIFTNRELKEGLPIMASAIKREDKIEAIIMVWDIEFEALTMYHINLFITVTKIITNSVQKALDYCDRLGDIYKLKYHYHDQGLYLLPEKEFAQVCQVAQEAEKKYGIPYFTDSISLVNTSLDEAIISLRPILKNNSFIHHSITSLVVLVNNSSEADNPNPQTDAIMARIINAGNEGEQGV